MSRGAFEAVAAKLGFTRIEGSHAYDVGIAQYQRFVAAYRELGRKLLGEIQANPDRVYVALLGRPYNAFTRDANMGIPRKFISQAVTALSTGNGVDLQGVSGNLDFDRIKT